MLQRTDSSSCLQAVHDRHHNIHQNHIKTSCFGFRKFLNCLGSIPCFFRFRPCFRQIKFGNFHINFVVLHHQDLHSGCISLFRLLPLPIAASRIIEKKRKLKCEGRSLSRHAFHLNRTVHTFDQALDNRHAKTASLILCPRICLFLCKGLKQLIFYKFFLHANAGVRNPKLIKSLLSIAGKLFCIGINPAARLIVFDCIAQKIDHDLAQMQRVSDQSCMPNSFSVSVMPDSGFLQLGFHQRGSLGHELFQIKGFHHSFFLLCLNAPHVQNIIDQRQQMSGGQLDLSKTFLDPFPVIHVPSDDLQHTHHTIDRCLDIMAHTV